MLKSNNVELDHSPSVFGRLRDSTDYVKDAAVLRSRLAEDGYLYLRDLVDRRTLSEAREVILDKFVHRSLRDSNVELIGKKSQAASLKKSYHLLEDLNQHPALKQIARQSPLIDVFSLIFGEAAVAFDYLWPRLCEPGTGALPHSDWVYMRRGTKNILSVWIPVIDVPIELGPLAILENSHFENPHTQSYLTLDADRLGFFDGLRLKHGRLIRGGNYSERPDKVQQEFGTRWLTEDFSVGDIVIFDPCGIHMTLDNRMSDPRISVDMRFQPARESRDPRFFGSNPIAHEKRQKSIFSLLKKTLFLGRRR